MKKFAVLLLAVIMVFTSFGCRFPDITDYLESIIVTDEPENVPTPTPISSSREDGRTPAPTVEPTAAPTPRPIPAGVPQDISDYAYEAVLKAESIMDEAVAYVNEHRIEGSPNTVPFTGMNLFRNLTHTEMMIYENLLVSAKNFTDYKFSVADEESLGRIRDALLYDHPELEIYFDVELIENDGSGESAGRGGNGGGRESGGSGGGRESGGSGGGRESGGSGDRTGTGISAKAVFFDPDSRYYGPTNDIEALKEKVEAFNTVVDYVVSRIPSDYSAIDKYRVLAIYISINTQYLMMENEEIPRYTMNAFGSIVNGFSICQGYTIGFEYLCRAADLFCRRLTNGRTDENMHYWDIVSIDGDTYLVDVTWSDTSVSYYTDFGWKQWFMFTTDEHHRASDGTVTTGAAFDKSGWQ